MHLTCDRMFVMGIIYDRGKYIHFSMLNLEIVIYIYSGIV